MKKRISKKVAILIGACSIVLLSAGFVIYKKYQASKEKLMQTTIDTAKLSSDDQVLGTSEVKIDFND